HGNAYEYRVHEIDPPEGYVVQYSEDGLEIFNKYQGDVSSIQKDKPNAPTPLEKNTEPKEENRDKPMSNGVLPQTGVGNRVLIISGGFMIGMGILILLKKKD
ncbi:LPXTG cell wall anchor domain-containing protein, partial [Erysipelothrix rhusiopathiae]|nr:LPXTG cell wall anchor domain-containing protein [Erysipelothrix rhusiopathiae]